MKKYVKIVSIIVAIIVVLICLIGGGLTFYSFISDYNDDNNEIIEEGQTTDEEIEKSIFKDYYIEAKRLVSKMSIEEKVGQLFLVRYNKADVEYLSNFYPGGYILFAKDIEPHTKESLKKELAEDQRLNKYGLIIGVDEEGGYVTRVSRYKNFRTEKFQSPKYYYEEGGFELLESVENEKATLLKELGFNLNLAPVADISTSENDFIYTRSFGKDATQTSKFIKEMVKYANNNKINSCLKHFPGYGNNVDTHTGIAIDNRSYENFQEYDYLPFQAGIEQGVPSILVSHNVVNSIDSNYPASLSKNIVTELREKLGFTGIIMTDDLAMDAVKSYVQDGQAATLAINAGDDMLITSDFISMYKEVLNSIQEGKIKVETLNKAVERIIAWKYYSGIL